MTELRSLPLQQCEESVAAIAADRHEALWRRSAGALAVLLAVMIGVYWETAFSMVSTWWRSETFAHGFVIVPICLYLIWARRQDLYRIVPEQNLWGAACIAVLSIFWLSGNLASVLVVQQFAFVAMIPALVLSLLGRNVLRALTFPLAYLFFAVPVGEFLIPTLRDWTAWFSVMAIRLSGVPVYWEGRYISVPNGNWEVAEACSGLRYLIASLAVGCLYAYLTYRSARKRAIFIGISIIVPVLANAMRAYGIIMLGYLSNMHLATGIDHIIYGWIFFGVVVFGLFWVGSWWRDPPPEPAGHRVSGVSSEGRHLTTSPPRPGAALVAACFGVLAAAMVGPAGAMWLEQPTPAGKVVIELPGGRQGWVGPRAIEDRWDPDYHRWMPYYPQGGESLRRVYSRGQDRVYVYIIHYPHQRQGRELISFDNHVYDGRYWRRVTDNPRNVPLSAGRVIRLHETAMRSPEGRRVVWHWYDVGGHLTENPWVGKFWESWARIWHRDSGATLVMIAANYQEHPARARRILESFLRDFPIFASSGALIGQNGKTSALASRP